MSVHVHEHRGGGPAAERLRCWDVHSGCEAHGEVRVTKFMVVEPVVVALDLRAFVGARETLAVLVAVPAFSVDPFDDAVGVCRSVFADCELDDGLIVFGQPLPESVVDAELAPPFFELGVACPVANCVRDYGRVRALFNAEVV